MGLRIAVSVPSAADRLGDAADHLQLAAKALAQLAQVSEPEDIALVPHADRIESRVSELMRTMTRLARDLGVSSAWGLEIFFAAGSTIGPQDRTTPVATMPPVELEPIELLDPIARPLDDRQPMASVMRAPLDTPGPSDAPPPG